jgi:hypothetical protein
MNKISVGAAGVGVGAALVVVFILCAIVQVVAPGVQASHMWVSLFTTAPITSPNAWVAGILGGGIGGYVAGSVFAWTYNYVAKRNA